MRRDKIVLVVGESRKHLLLYTVPRLDGARVSIYKDNKASVD